MTNPSVVVVGAGAAGTAAAYAVADQGVKVRLFDAGLGASCLSSGSVDQHPWETVCQAFSITGQQPSVNPFSEPLERFLRAFELWETPPAGQPFVRLATMMGRIRLARGRDRSLLDLAALPDRGRVLLPRWARAEWDADSLARTLQHDPYARARAWQFAAVDVELWREEGEQLISAADLAARHDDDERLQWLIGRLSRLLKEQRDAGQSVDGLLLGPWLGAQRPRAPALSEALSIPIGEVLGCCGSAAGLRFEAARERLLTSIGVKLERSRVAALRPRKDAVQIRFDERDDVLTATSVVLAVGGLAGGGMRYVPSESTVTGGNEPAASSLPSRAFELSVDAPITWQCQGAIDTVSSLQGPALDEVAWPTGDDPSLLETVGIVCDQGLVAPRVFAAGAVLAQQARTMLQAVASGLEAGKAAAQLGLAQDE